MRNGQTLLETALVLTLVGVLGSASLPVGSRFRDGRAVNAAREAVVGLLAEARLQAVSHGGAVVHVEADPWRAWSEARGVTLRTVPLYADFGVVVELSRARTSSEIRFDAMGLGRFAGETLRFRRGESDALLVVSSFGRVRRR